MIPTSAFGNFHIIGLRLQATFAFELDKHQSVHDFPPLVWITGTARSLRDCRSLSSALSGSQAILWLPPAIVWLDPGAKTVRPSVHWGVGVVVGGTNRQVRMAGVHVDQTLASDGVDQLEGSGGICAPFPV